jgi:DNA polymerase-4
VKVYFHVDLDAFYASVEVLDNPELAGKPIVVGARPGHRGVVSSCSYEARRFGIRSAMPISEAQRRCPGAVFLPVRMSRYLTQSEAVMAVLGSYTPELRQISIDEASMDMSGTERLFGPPLEAGRRIKGEVLERTGLTLSIGIAPNRYLAKLASERSKPDGLLLVAPGDEAAFLDGLSLKDLWGVGKRTLERLAGLGLATIPQLRALSEGQACARLGEASGRYLYRAVRGLDPGIYPTSPKSHSVSSETTFEEDVDDPAVLKRVLLELAEGLTQRLIREKLKADTVVLKLRYFDFTTTTAQKKLGRGLSSSEELLETALRLLDSRWDRSTPIRLIGVGAAGAASPRREVQGELFQEPSSRQRKVEETISELRESISGLKITRASLLESGRPKPADPGAADGAPRRR